MTLLAPSAPLLTIAHDWTSPVERTTSYPSRALTKWDGSEQRQSLSHLPVTTIRYRLISPTSADAVQLAVLATLADDALVRVPRWEDQSRVDTLASSGAAVVIACDTTDRDTYAVGSEVILWRSPSSYEVTTIDAVTTTSITADLVSSWAAGTIIAPIAECRLVLPLGMDHWAPTSGVPELTVMVGLRDLAGLGTGGTAGVGVPFAISVTDTTIALGGRGFVQATVTDAVGNVLSGDDIVWTIDALDVAIYATGDPRVAVVSPAAWYFARTATATIGAVVGTGTVFIAA